MARTINEILVGDEGTQFVLCMVDKGQVVDISAATAMTITLRRDGDKSKSYPATLTTDGVDGNMEIYSTESTFYDHGDWKAQGRVELPSGKWRTGIVAFHVYENL